MSLAAWPFLATSCRPAPQPPPAPPQAASYWERSDSKPNTGNPQGDEILESARELFANVDRAQREAAAAGEFQPDPNDSTSIEDNACYWYAIAKQFTDRLSETRSSSPEIEVYQKAFEDCSSPRDFTDEQLENANKLLAPAIEFIEKGMACPYAHKIRNRYFYPDSWTLGIHREWLRRHGDWSGLARDCRLADHTSREFEAEDIIGLLLAKSVFAAAEQQYALSCLAAAPRNDPAVKELCEALLAHARTPLDLKRLSDKSVQALDFKGKLDVREQILGFGQRLSDADAKEALAILQDISRRQGELWKQPYESAAPQWKALKEDCRVKLARFYNKDAKGNVHYEQYLDSGHKEICEYRNLVQSVAFLAAARLYQDRTGKFPSSAADLKDDFPDGPPISALNGKPLPMTFGPREMAIDWRPARDEYDLEYSRLYYPPRPQVKDSDSTGK
jgi:hypothetical protein